MKKMIKDYRENVSKRLMIRQVIFFVIVSILMVISIENVLKEKIGVILAISGFVFALAIGLALSRMFRIFWNQEQEKVVSKLDMLGTILLMGYICAEVGRKFIFQYWLYRRRAECFWVSNSNRTTSRKVSWHDYSN